MVVFRNWKSKGIARRATTVVEDIAFLRNESGSWNMTLEGFTGDWVAFGEDVNGELYISSLTGGNVYRLTDALLSIDDNDLNSVKIYPNPAKTNIYLDFSGQSSANSTEISIFDIQGKIVKTFTRTNETVQSLSISELKSGFYVLKISSENGAQRTDKFVIN